MSSTATAAVTDKEDILLAFKIAEVAYCLLHSHMVVVAAAELEHHKEDSIHRHLVIGELIIKLVISKQPLEASTTFTIMY